MAWGELSTFLLQNCPHAIDSLWRPIWRKNIGAYISHYFHLIITNLGLMWRNVHGYPLSFLPPMDGSSKIFLNNWCKYNLLPH